MTQQYSWLFNHPLHPLPSNPLLTKIQHNIDVTFVHTASQPVAPDLGDACIVALYYVLMVDEIKVEECPHWDLETNMILGICREHSAKLSLNFCLLDDLEIICNTLAEGRAHVATEVYTFHSAILNLLMSFLSGHCGGYRNDVKRHMCIWLTTHPYSGVMQV
jgi:hypothetical protein